MKQIIRELLEQYEKDMDMPQFAIQYYPDEYIISKHYGFIKWLVDNDKIDLDMVREKLWIPCCVWYTEWKVSCVNDKEDYKQLLMLLSISDTPIDDLISYLR